MTPIIRLFPFLLLLVVNTAAYASVTASVDRDHLAIGDSFNLLLQNDGNASGQPDLAPLQQDFDVLGRSTGTSLQIINGRTSTQSQLRLILSPKHDGNLRIPPLQWNGEWSPALSVTVGGHSAPGKASNSGDIANDAHVFINTRIDQQPVYVQATPVLTVRLYTDQPLYQANLDLPGSSDVLVKQLGKDAQTSESHSGRNYQVIERQYLLFPQHSGTIHLDGPIFEGQIADDHDQDPFFAGVFGKLQLPRMMTTTRPIHLRGKPIELTVLPRPSNVTSANWLPSQRVTLSESWRPDNLQVHAGEPLTRHLTLEALGLSGGQLPELATLLRLPEGIKSYPDQSVATDSERGNTLLGQRNQDIALIAQQPGRYTLPPIKLSWWDTSAKSLREAVLPAREIDVLPALGNKASASPAAPLATTQPPTAATEITPQVSTSPLPASAGTTTGKDTRWMWISLALGLLWLGTVLTWWITQRKRRHQITPDVPLPVAKPKPEAPAGKALQSFKAACRANDAPEARRHLLAWAKSIWANNPPNGLNALAKRLDDPATAEQIRQLDRAWCTGSTWQGESLVNFTPPLSEAKKATENKSHLASLYPQ